MSKDSESLIKKWGRISFVKGLEGFCCFSAPVWPIFSASVIIKHNTASLSSLLLFIHHTGCGIWQMYRHPLTAVFFFIVSERQAQWCHKLQQLTHPMSKIKTNKKKNKKKRLYQMYSILLPAASQKAKMKFMCILKGRSLLVLIKKSCHIPKRMCQLERSQPFIENKWGR